MDKKELKKILKPLIKECIKEVIFEDGTLSTIISEVAIGLASPTREKIVETSKIDDSKRTRQKQLEQSRRKQKLLNSIGKDAYNGVNLFEGTTPAAQTSQTHSPLSGTDPSDPGVDLSNFMGSSELWKKVIGK